MTVPIQAVNTAGSVDGVVESTAFLRPTLIFHPMNTRTAPKFKRPATNPPMITGLLSLAENKIYYIRMESC